MGERKISPRHSGAILQAFSNGVTPRIGLEHVVVGRSAETTAMLDDLDYQVSKEGASFRLVVGPYGSGKSFMLQVIRNYALQRNFVVADADLSAERRLTGTKGQGVGYSHAPGGWSIRPPARTLDQYHSGTGDARLRSCAR
jgi:hypothetical protein